MVWQLWLRWAGEPLPTQPAPGSSSGIQREATGIWLGAGGGQTPWRQQGRSARQGQQQPLWRSGLCRGKGAHVLRCPPRLPRACRGRMRGPGPLPAGKKRQGDGKPLARCLVPVPARAWLKQARVSSARRNLAPEQQGWTLLWAFLGGGGARPSLLREEQALRAKGALTDLPAQKMQWRGKCGDPAADQSRA